MILSKSINPRNTLLVYFEMNFIINLEMDTEKKIKNTALYFLSFWKLFNNPTLIN